MMKNETTRNAKTSFSAVVMFSDSNDEETFDVELEKDVQDLTYDDVEMAICDEVDKKHGFTIEDFEDESPYEIVSIVVNEGDDSYPVISESDDDTELKNSKVYTKYLVLPWTTYALTPECKLWMKMKETGFIDEDEPFDYEVYHELVSNDNEKK